MCLAQSFFVSLMFRDIARNSQQAFRLAFRVANGADHDIPPPGLLCSRCGEIAREAPGATLPGRLHGFSHGFRVIAFPKLKPGAVHERAQVADLKRLHAAFVHPQQAALQVKHLDAILATGDETALKLLGIPERPFRCFPLRYVFG
jgi:hypothetical protein